MMHVDVQTAAPNVSFATSDIISDLLNDIYYKLTSNHT